MRRLEMHSRPPKTENKTIITKSKSIDETRGTEELGTCPPMLFYVHLCCILVPFDSYIWMIEIVCKK